MTDLTQFKAALKSITEEVCNSLGGQEVPTRLWIRIVREDEQKTSFPTESRIDFSALSIQTYRILERSSNLQGLIKIIQDNSMLAGRLLVDAAGQAIAQPESQHSWVINFVNAFLLSYFNEVNQINFADQKFDQFCNRVLQFNLTYHFQKCRVG